MKKTVLFMMMALAGGTLVIESCKKEVKGCKDPLALNYNKDATVDDKSCEYENIDTTNNDTIVKGPCDGTAYTYITDIKPIIDAHCITCHKPGGGGFGKAQLDTYNGVKTSSTTGKLLDAINHRAGVKPMPDGAPKLSEELIKKFECWVEKGTPEN